MIKRRSGIVVLMIAVIIFIIYVIIPSSKEINIETVSTSSQSGVIRIMFDKNNRESWWPGQKKEKDLYSFQGFEYRIDKIFFPGISFTLFQGKDSIHGILLILDGGTNGTTFQWKSTCKYSNNPINKLIEYNDFSNFEKNIRGLLNSLKNYFDKQENIYGLKIQKQNVVDASLISLKHTFKHEPTVNEIYTLLDSLQEYIRIKQGKQNNLPMLNIHSDDSTNYQVMVAVPTTTDLPSEGNFQLKKMVLGKILVAEVRGGNATINQGLLQLNNFVNDFKKISPAIPFQSLVTNRRLETDTNKWITRLYYPIFN